MHHQWNNPLLDGASDNYVVTYVTILCKWCLHQLCSTMVDQFNCCTTCTTTAL